MANDTHCGDKQPRIDPAEAQDGANDPREADAEIDAEHPGGED